MSAVQKLQRQQQAGSKPDQMPSAVTDQISFFDRFAGRASRIVSRAPFFAFCLLLVIVWLPSIAVIKTVDTWQLIINTVTTIVTFLLVALLQNSQERSDEAVQHKLNALAQGLASLIEHAASDDRELRDSIAELKDAVGLEDRESS